MVPVKWAQPHEHFTLNTQVTFNSFSQAAENNKEVILEKLRGFFVNEGVVLEIGSGTGQHAVHFASDLTHLVWQPSDQGEYLATLIDNIKRMTLLNIRQPLSLGVAMEQWPVSEVDYVYSANTLHIMSSGCVELFMCGVGSVLTPRGLLIVYGPFKYDNEFTTESNAKFDLWLKGRDAQRGIRDIEMIRQLATDSDLVLKHDFGMPANNQLLVFQKQ